MKMLRSCALSAALALMSPCHAALTDFAAGPVFSEFGKHAPVPGITIAADQRFNIAFDVAAGAEPGAINRSFNTLARFINMHVANGAALENINLALVIHGAATVDTLNNAQYKQRKDTDNGNTALLKALMDKGVRIIVCGQSAAANNISADMLESGITMDLSAMTAHARLAEQGYRVNPF